MTIKPTEDEIDIIKQLTNAVVELQDQIRELQSRPPRTIEIKDTTGDYATANSWDSRMVLNTFDTNLKILEGGTWRLILNW